MLAVTMAFTHLAGSAYGDALLAFRYSDGAGMKDLGTLGAASDALGINTAGKVVGYSEVPGVIQNDEWHPGPAFLYTDRRGMQDLNSLIDP